MKTANFIKTLIEDNLKILIESNENAIKAAILAGNVTDEIKEKILANRIYKIPKLVKNEKKITRDKTEIARLTDNEYYNYIYLLRPEESVLNKNNIYLNFI